MVTKYDSKFEDDFSSDNEGYIVRCPVTFAYKFEADCKYTADFTYHTKSGKTVYVELKGSPMWFKADYRKRWLQMYEQMTAAGKDIRLVIQKPGTKLIGCKKMTFEIWAEKNNVKYCFGTKLPEEWLNE